MTHVHPSEDWRLMKTGAGLNDVARMAGDDPVVLDRAIWDWLATRHGAGRPGHARTVRS